MFLNNLQEHQKAAFIALAECVIKADSKFTNIEQMLLDQFYMEMNLSSNHITHYSFSEAIDIFHNADKRIRKQMFIELFALANADKEFADKEKELIEDIANRFDISIMEQEELRHCVLDLLEVYERMQKLVTE